MWGVHRGVLRGGVERSPASKRKGSLVKSNLDLGYLQRGPQHTQSHVLDLGHLVEPNLPMGTELSCQGLAFGLGGPGGGLVHNGRTMDNLFFILKGSVLYLLLSVVYRHPHCSPVFC